MNEIEKKALESAIRSAAILDIERAMAPNFMSHDAFAHQISAITAKYLDWFEKRCSQEISGKEYSLDPFLPRLVVNAWHLRQGQVIDEDFVINKEGKPVLDRWDIGSYKADPVSEAA